MNTPTPISSVVALPEYLRDLKALSRRFRGLDEDIRIFVEKPLTHFLRGEPVAGRYERVAGLGFEYPAVYVAKRLACRALRGRGSDSGLRLVCAWFPKEDRLELVELYVKADKNIEDKARIKRTYGRWPRRRLMPGNREPLRLGRGRAFHAALQREWRHDVKEPVTAEKAIRKPSGRAGRIDVFVDDGGRSVSVVELKDTDWDAMTPAAVIRNVGRQCRQVWSYIDSQLAEGRQISPGIIFRKRPTDPELLVLVERLFNAKGIAVAWHDETLAACRKRHSFRGNRANARPRQRTRRSQ